MGLVREINQSRVSSHVGDRLGRLGLAIPNTDGETSLPDIQAGGITTVAPIIRLRLNLRLLLIRSHTRRVFGLLGNHRRARCAICRC